METVEVCTNGCLRLRLAVSSRCVALMAAGLVGLAASAGAQSITTASNAQQPPLPSTARTIEWKLPVQGDNRAGAITVDQTGGNGSRIWFVTRFGTVRVYRLDIRGNKRVNKQPMSSWNLDPNSFTTGGLKRIRASKDQRFVFVRSTEAIQRIDTGKCPPPTTSSTLTVSTNPPCLNGMTWHRQNAVPVDGTAALADAAGISDLTVDDYNNVYATFAISGPDPSAVDQSNLHSFVQKLNPNASTNNVTRWYVGGSAGRCGVTAFSGDSDPCLSGVTVHPSKQTLVYYSEPTGGVQIVNRMPVLNDNGAIGELDTVNHIVRRWSLKDLGDDISDPRQLIFDNDGTLWCVTGSGHVISLDPKTNRMSRHTLPGGQSDDLFGVAPDGRVVGYTAAAFGNGKVGMLLPKAKEMVIYPTVFGVAHQPFTIPPGTFETNQIDDQATPVVKTVTIMPGSTAEGDRVIDALTDSATPGPSSIPLGIIPDRSGSVGTFFYAVGLPSEPTFNMIGRIRLPKNAKARIERDDDDIDDDDKKADVDDDVDGDGTPNALDADNDNDSLPDIMDDDDDNDGIEDTFDTPDKRETKQSSDQDVLAGSYAEDVFTVNPGTLLVVASAVSGNLLAPVACEILDSTGTVVAASLAAAGTSAVTFIPPSAGGTYTLRVKNQSTGLTTISTSILTRELWPLPIIGGAL